MPFAVLVNLLRIILTGALAYYISPAVLGSLVHAWTGTITFFIALILFIAMAEFLQRRFSVTHQTKQEPLEIRANQTSRVFSSGETAGSSRFFFLGVALLSFTLWVSLNMGNPAPVPLKKSLESLPEQVGPFVPFKGHWSEPYQDPSAELSVSRVYTRAGVDSAPVEVFVGHRSLQRDSKRLASPKLNFPYLWNFVHIEAGTLQVPGTGVVEGSWMLTRKGEHKRLVFYWYQAGGNAVGNDMRYRLHQAGRILIQGRTDAAIVRVATVVQEDESLEQAKARVADFVSQFYLKLLEVLPG
jgi:EpsI family protein